MAAATAAAAAASLFLACLSCQQLLLLLLLAVAVSGVGPLLGRLQTSACFGLCVCLDVIRDFYVFCFIARPVRLRFVCVGNGRDGGRLRRG